ncbi:MAG TPA: MOSC domain-containing protein [Herpetosiphonaceae bacterium]
MITIHSILIGQPQTITDEQGIWESSIFRTPVTGAIELTTRGLLGDHVTDTERHGTPDQAVCCHLLAHYDHWNAAYNLTDPQSMLGPGSVGENWTLVGIDENTSCIGDIYSVGTAQVQISGPRVPCWKQERKLKLPDFLKQTRETLRTGFYLRVLQPGVVQPGDQLRLEARPLPDLTQNRINVCAHHALDVAFAERLLETPELAAGWKRILRYKLDHRSRD